MPTSIYQAIDRRQDTKIPDDDEDDDDAGNARDAGDAGDAGNGVADGDSLLNVDGINYIPLSLPWLTRNVYLTEKSFHAIYIIQSNTTAHQSAGSLFRNRVSPIRDSVRRTIRYANILFESARRSDAPKKKKNFERK